MSFGKKIQDIKAVEIARDYTVGGKTVTFRLRNVYTGLVNDREELLDKVSIGNILEQMAQTVY